VPSANRNRMIEALHSVVVPALARRGLSGSFPDFRRINPHAVDLLSFHFARHEQAFTVEVASGPAAGASLGGQLVPASQLTVWHVLPHERYRLGPDEPDQWFRYRKRFFSFSDPHLRAARAVLPYLDSQAERWWKQNARS
jgi:hypothetical protein